MGTQARLGHTFKRASRHGLGKGHDTQMSIQHEQIGSTTCVMCNLQPQWHKAWCKPLPPWCWHEGTQPCALRQIDKPWVQCHDMLLQTKTDLRHDMTPLQQQGCLRRMANELHKATMPWHDVAPRRVLDKSMVQLQQGGRSQMHAQHRGTMPYACR